MGKDGVQSLISYVQSHSSSGKKKDEILHVSQPVLGVLTQTVSGIYSSLNNITHYS